MVILVVNLEKNPEEESHIEEFKGSQKKIDLDGVIEIS